MTNSYTYTDEAPDERWEPEPYPQPAWVIAYWADRNLPVPD